MIGSAPVFVDADKGETLRVCTNCMGWFKVNEHKECKLDSAPLVPPTKRARIADLDEEDEDNEVAVPDAASEPDTPPLDAEVEAE